MARPTVLVYHPHDASTYARLIGPARRRVTVRVAANPGDAAEAIGEADVLYGWNVPSHLFEKAHHLRWLQAMSAGVDWALVPELPARVTVTRVPGVFGPWMAEYVMGWSLWVTQRMATYREAQGRSAWIDQVLPDRLRGKTLAIVGVGDVGGEVARAARGFGMRVIGVSRSGRAVPGVDRVYRSGALRRALALADFVVLALPLTGRTRHLIGPAELAAMRPGAWLLNVARGPVVDEDALRAALEARRIGGVVLDVFATEPLPAGHPLWGFDNVVITPHIAGPSVPEEIAPIFDDNLRRLLAGRRLRHVVDRARGY